jgi:hypothetical protein
MTLEQSLLLAQTMILLLTGAAVVWYTVETAKIRRATSYQANLLAEQLSMLRAQSERDETRRSASVQPQFRYVGGHETDQHSVFVFQNVGEAPIRDISVSSIDYQMSIDSTAYLAVNDRLTLTVPFLKRPTPRFEFSLEFTDALGARRGRHFTHVGENRFEDRPAAI